MKTLLPCLLLCLLSCSSPSPRDGGQGLGLAGVGNIQSDLVAGRLASPLNSNSMLEDQDALAYGKWLYTSFNCVGCHAQGGGAIGPALMDAEWIYGGQAQNIYWTILEGRPNGMPSFAGKISNAAMEPLVAYVLSLSRGQPK